MAEQEPVNEMAEIYPECVDFDPCAVADQLDLVWGYTSIYQTYGEDDLEMPASFLSENLAWMLRAYGDPEIGHIGDVEIMRRMAGDFGRVLEHLSVPDSPEVEPRLQEAIKALYRLETACDQAGGS